MKDLLVSIILPTHNREKTVTRALNSLFEQTYKNIEIIIINDASTDDTGKIISKFSKKDTRIVILNNETGLGLAESLNKGIKRATGKYIARLDDDDFWCDKMKLEKQVDFLEKNKEYVLVGGGAKKIDKNGKELSKYLLPERDEDIKKEILISNVLVHIAVLFRKEAWEKVGGYDKKFDGIEDWELWLRMGTIGKFYNLQQFFVCYSGHQYKNPSYFDRSHKRLEMLKLVIKMKKSHRNHYPGYRKAILFCWVAYCYSFQPFKDVLLPLTLMIRKLFFGVPPYKYH